MITLFFWSRFIFQKAQLCQEREEDVVTRAEAQCLQAVREERRDAALAEVQDFQFSGPEEDLFPARKRGGVFLGFLGRCGWMPAVLLMLRSIEEVN